MKEISFVKTSPTQNMTILIKTEIPLEERLAVAEKLIAYENVYAEQAGYIVSPQNSNADGGLYMMAGEFCGNATLSLAAYLLRNEDVGIGEKRNYMLEVSGIENLIACEVERRADDFWGKVDMPLPQSIEKQSLPFLDKETAFTVVTFAGISHVVVPCEVWGEDAKKFAHLAVEQWKKYLPEVFGILLWDEKQSFAEPLVYVKDVSLIWERGCGSGTSAVGAYLAMQAGESISQTIHQPGGAIEVEVVLKEGKITDLRISGSVKIVAEGKAYI